VREGPHEAGADLLAGIASSRNGLWHSRPFGAAGVWRPMLDGGRGAVGHIVERDNQRIGSAAARELEPGHQWIFPATRYADALAELIGDRDVDTILVINCPTGLVQPERGGACGNRCAEGDSLAE
jgi:hypothetical protein